MTPLAIDLFCGLGGWADGFLDEGYDVIGFDIERHDYGTGDYPGQLVLQDVLTLHGSQFKDAAVIVASPPCQAYSYRAMPWKRAKALPPPDNTLFEACFRIAEEAGVPVVVENVQGAQKWVGRAKWHYGSYYLWGDVPALMPFSQAFKVPGFRFDGSQKSFQSESVKVSGLNWSGSDKPGYVARAFNTTAEQRLGNKGVPHRPTGHWRNPTENGTKCGDGNEYTSWFNDKGPGAATSTAHFGSKSNARKAASAQIAKIPFPLARWIAQCFKPEVRELCI